MKKFILLALPLLMMSMLFVGCSKNKTQNSNDIRTSQEGYQNTETSQSQEQEKPKETKSDNEKIIDLNSMPEVIMKTTMGDIRIKLFAEDSPKTVENFLKLAKEDFYNGTRFHRVISDFMIQGGDPLSKDDDKKGFWGTGGPGYKFEDEFNDHKIVKGSLAMANSGPNTNGSQFFIVTAEATPWLDGRHTNFGMVVEGQDVVDKIGVVQTDPSDKPLTDIFIKDIEIVETK